MTRFEAEIREQPAVLQNVLNDPASADVGAALRADPPALALSFARGSSDNAVGFFAYLAGMRLGLPVASVPPSLVTIHRAPLRGEGALAVGVSQSGESQDVVEALRAMATAGARTLAVSNGPGSSLERVATWSLQQRAGEERAVAASKTFTSQMMVLARLVMEWSDEDDGRAALAAVPPAIHALLADTSALDTAAARLTHADQLDVLGRGLSFAPALEVALKLKETSYLHAHAYSSAEFQHGPIASLGAGDPVLLLGVADASAETTREAARRIAEAGADLTVVASDPELLAVAAAPVPLPGGLPPLAEAFLHVVAGQWMALQLAGQRGLDPDAPRHLQKVTQTR
ncbi:MAG: SIS domain-containing protein [Deinococcus-Thermus bacterium]|jgi:glucosamine--fructose-6-phosphate aminotransferase (isomerizing)|nr:SIS domain-containing protein [Deinococcota bacterium]